MKKISLKELAIGFTIFVFTLSILWISSNNIVKAAQSLSSKLSGKILLQVESNGEAWYLNPQDNKRSFLGRPHDAFAIMREEGVGITNDNLNKIPLSLDNLSGTDTDNDKLPDNFEIAIGTDPNNSDTDSDGYDDYVEVENNYSPKGDNAKRQTIDKSFAKSHQGKIFIQVEGNGEAWYVDTIENKRHYLGRPSDAFSIMRNLGLGITNANLEQIIIREGKGIQEYNYSEPKSEEGNNENKEEYKNRITVTTHKPEPMREFTNIIHVSATINDSSGYDFKEKGFLFDYTMNKDEVLTPTLSNHKEKLIDTTPGLNINAEIDDLLPKSYPYIRAYVITAEDIVYYGDTEVLILGNTESIDSIGAPGTPPTFGGGGGGGSVSKPSDPEEDEDIEYVTLTYIAGDGGFVTTEELDNPISITPSWEIETTVPFYSVFSSSASIDNDIYLLGGMGFDEYSFGPTSSVFKFDTIGEEWTQVSNMTYSKENSFSTVVDGKIYNIGHDEHYYYLYPPVGEVYDPQINSWSEIPMLSRDMEPYYFFENINGGVFNDRIYIIGSTFSEEERSSIFDYEVLIYDPSTEIWERGSSSPFTTYSEVDSVVYNNGLFYVFSYDSTVHTYNPLTNEWNSDLSSKPNLSDESFGRKYVSYGDYILSLGGLEYNGTTDEEYLVDTIYLYDTVNDYWIQVFDMSRENAAFSSTIVNNHLYVMGGISDPRTGQPINSNYKIDLSFLNQDYLEYLLSIDWQTKNSLPYSLAGAGSVNINDAVYLVGGFSDDEETNSPLIMSYNSDSDEWTEEALIPSDPENMLSKPLGIVNPMTVNIANDIYIFGGRTDYYTSSSSLKYNITTQEFTKLPDMSFEITNPFGGVYNDKIYIFGGSYEDPIGLPGLSLSEKIEKAEEENNDLNLQATDFFFEIYNPETNSFEEGDIMPTSYGYYAKTIMVDGVFYIIGGHDDSFNISNQTLSYNPETNTWNTLANMPESLIAGSLAYNNGKIYYIGGFNMNGPKKTIYEYNIYSNTWNELSKNLPEFLFENSAQFIEDYLYVIGGLDENQNTINEVYALDFSVIDIPYEYIIEQRIPKGGNGEPVYVLPDSDNKFVYWSDGSTDPSRVDYNIETDTVLVAYFTYPFTMKFAMEEGEELTIPTYPEKEYFAEIDWGDDSEVSTITSWDDLDLSHSYDDSGVYDVSITGYFPHIYFNNEGNKDNLLEIVNWGNINFDSFENSFYGCENLEIIPNSSITGAKNATSFKNAFNSSSIYIIPSNLFDNVPEVEDFSYAFYGANIDYLPSGLFDYTTKVEDFSYMFYSTYVYSGGPIEAFDLLDNTTHMNAITSIPDGLFNNTKDVTDFSYMFYGNRVSDIPEGLFDQTSEVRNFSHMFFNAYNPIQANSEGEEIILEDKELLNDLMYLPSGLFDYTTKVEDFSYMFYKNPLREIPSGLFDNTSEVITFEGMFENCYIDEIPSGLFDYTTKVEDFSRMFVDNGITNLPSGIFDNNSEVITFSEMFYDNPISTLPEGLFDYNINAEDFSWMFYEHNIIATITPGLLDNNVKAKNLSGMFAARTWSGRIREIPADLFKYTTEVEDLSSMFAGNQIQSIPAGLFDTNTKVKSFNAIFHDWESCDITEIPEGLFDYNTEAEDFSNLFAYCRITEIPEGLFDNNTKAKSFGDTFQKTLITEIPVDLFKYNTEVESFAYTFADNNISSIPPGMFDTNTKVTSFSSTFRNNNIGVIPDNLFDNNPNVTDFSGVFSSNNISVIPENLFDNNPNVTDFSGVFSSNNISVIPENLFYNNPNVINFSAVFENNNISVIPENIFTSMTKVTAFHFTFASNNISVIPENLFDNNPNVTDFSGVFYSNNISVIPENLFANTPDVESFHWSFKDNDISIIPENIFTSTTKVTAFSFTFASNNISVIPENLFDNSPNVTSFQGVFEYNNISSIPENLFSNQHNAENFSSAFNTNNISIIPENLFINNPNASNFSSIFYRNNIINIPENLFINNRNVIYFTSAFKNNPTLTGLAPELWNTHSSANGSNCFEGDTGLSNYASIPSYWK